MASLLMLMLSLEAKTRLLFMFCLFSKFLWNGYGVWVFRCPDVQVSGCFQHCLPCSSPTNTSLQR